MIQVTDAVAVPDDELDWSYARSGGPGGQNVNKVSSKAVLRWPAGRTVALIPLAAWGRMKARFPSRFTADGDVLISSQEFRDQERNRQACIEKLAEMIRVSLPEPTPRKKLKVSKGAKKRRVADKRANSAKKQGRRGPAGED